eukprot:NODE_1689_length_2402_cov_5.126154.p1 GENE.NODE_1689_length_2402_cov_5.126154~~NODE_1689_length_2402_cov_5.126154.p1  ORF type:complete len:504 (+),score=132.29 NODE_1689_length_2402_cov_5.126154:675-2186(+)
MRGQLLASSWPDGFGAVFLNHFSTETSRASVKARDNALELFEILLDPLQDSCIVNGSEFTSEQCESMGNTLAAYAQFYCESFQATPLPAYDLQYKEGAGLFVKASVGDLLGYYGGYADPLSAYLFPQRVSWNVVRSQTQTQVATETVTGATDTENGILSSLPQGTTSLITNALVNLGHYTAYDGRETITDFDWSGCRPLADNGEVAVPPAGPFPPQCNGGQSFTVQGSAGRQITPRVWSLQPGADKVDSVTIFSKTLFRGMEYTFVENEEIEVGVDGHYLKTRLMELTSVGLDAARLAFNCDGTYRTMAESGIVNRGADCDGHEGIFDISARHDNIPYLWSLPHYYLVVANDSLQHPRNNLLGFVTPTGPRFRSLISVEPESGLIVESTIKEQISVQLYQDDNNYFFTAHKAVIIPLYWKVDTKNSTVSEKKLLYDFVSEFHGLESSFITCICFAAASLGMALFLGMLIYRASSFQAVAEKRKRIQVILSQSRAPDDDADAPQ